MNTQRFIQYLEKLRKDVGSGRFTLVLDNLRVHHSIAVREFAEKAEIDLLFCPPYSSEFAPIERLWALSKAIFRRGLLEDGKNKLSQSAVQVLIE